MIYKEQSKERKAYQKPAVTLITERELLELLGDACLERAFHRVPSKIVTSRMAARFEEGLCVLEARFG